MKPTNILTVLSIKKAKSKEKQYKLTDGEGMFLRVYPNGSKYWQLQYWFEGKQKILSLGVWPEVSLTQAREKRVEARKIIKQGIDPLQEKKQTIIKKHEQELEEEKGKQRKSITFKKVAEEWHQKQSPQWTEKHTIDVLNSLKNYVFPDLGERPISDIKKKEVIATLRKLESEGKYETCYRVRQRLEAIFSYAEIAELCNSNPASGLQKIFTKPKPKEHASLPIRELPVFLNKIVDDKVTSRSTKLAMFFMIHVFVRSKPQRVAKWIYFDIDCDEPLWVVPEYDEKTRVKLHVPLSPQVVMILNEMKDYSDPDSFVFPQVRNRQKPMSENTLLYFSNRIGYAGRNTIHGFRKVASTALHESGNWSYEAVEKQMSHLVGTKVSRIYNKAEHLDERRKMMNWWSDYIESLTLQEDVIS